MTTGAVVLERFHCLAADAGRASVSTSVVSSDHTGQLLEASQDHKAYSLSDVIMADEKLTLFHEYLRY